MISWAARQGPVFELICPQFGKVFPDEALSLVIVNGDGRRTLKALLRVQQIMTGIAAFIDPETFHSTFPWDDGHPDPIRQIKDGIIGAGVVS